MSIKPPMQLIGQSPALQHIRNLIEKVAESNSTILLNGESGTGKEVVAKTIHYQSGRAHHPFIPINCGAIPEALLESELFGHEKGAFTGAAAIRQGRFELADGGTLFFDEISEMPYPLQVKLLRAIQEREFERVGGSKSIRVNVRIIAAANVDLEQAVLEKKFRQDLFYRLNVIPILLPPLRERKEDIPLFVSHFLLQFNEKNHKTMKITNEAADFLTRYSWPGNIRELENMMERIGILAEGETITVEDLPPKIREGTNKPIPLIVTPEAEKPFWAAVFETAPDVKSAPDKNASDEALIPVPPPSDPKVSLALASWRGTLSDDGIDFTKLVEAFEDQLIQEALRKAEGVKNRAAQLLHLNRTTLVEKLKRKNKEGVQRSSESGHLPQGSPPDLP